MIMLMVESMDDFLDQQALSPASPTSSLADSFEDLATIVSIDNLLATDPGKVELLPNAIPSETKFQSIPVPIPETEAKLELVPETKPRPIG